MPDSIIPTHVKEALKFLIFMCIILALCLNRVELSKTLHNQAENLINKTSGELQSWNIHPNANSSPSESSVKLDDLAKSVINLSNTLSVQESPLKKYWGLSEKPSSFTTQQPVAQITNNDLVNKMVAPIQRFREYVISLENAVKYNDQKLTQFLVVAANPIMADLQNTQNDFLFWIQQKNRSISNFYNSHI